LGEIHLLPALPKAWRNGRVRGIRARGGYEIDMRWQEGGIVSASIQSMQTQACVLRMPNLLSVYSNEEVVPIEVLDNQALRFKAEAYHNLSQIDVVITSKK
jgi:alpha-L-fucosidase 2